MSVHSPPLRRGHSDQTVLQGAAGVFVPLGAPCRPAQSSGSGRPGGQDLSPPAAVLSAACKELLQSALPVQLPLQSLPQVWKETHVDKKRLSLYSFQKGDVTNRSLAVIMCFFCFVLFWVFLPSFSSMLSDAPKT